MSFVFHSTQKVVPTRPFSLFSTTFDVFCLQINSKSGTYTPFFSLWYHFLPSRPFAPQIFPAKYTNTPTQKLQVSQNPAHTLYISLLYYRFSRKTSCSIVIFVSRIHCFNSSNIPASFPSNFSLVSGFNFTPYPA